jgi:hypothetical protein
MGRSSNSFTAWTGQANELSARALLPEERLFVAVLSQAAHDAFSTHVPRLEREAARAFFIGNSKRFRDICELAGRESQYVHEKVKKRIFKSNGWNLDESMRKVYRHGSIRKKRGRYKKKHLTGNAYYAARSKKNFYYQDMGAKGGRPRIYNKIET